MDDRSKTCPCCDGSGFVIDDSVRVLEVQLFLDSKEIQRPLTLKTKRGFALTEIQYCENSKKFFMADLKLKKVYRKLICVKDE